MQFHYSIGTSSPHIACTELCNIDGNKIKVDIKSSAIIRKFAKMYGIETYCFKSKYSETISSTSKQFYFDSYKEQSIPFYDSNLSFGDKVLEVEETTEFLIVKFFSALPNSIGSPLNNAISAALCIKIDSDIV